MRKRTHIKSYTATDLKANRVRSRTDLRKVDAMSDAELERVIADDEDERNLQPDWTRAKLVLVEPKQSVHLRLEQEIINYFKAQGKGHISRMQAVLNCIRERSQATCQMNDQKHLVAATGGPSVFFPFTVARKP